jgi:PleD family two-component response regulator
MLKCSFNSFCATALLAFALSACTPTYDWREVHGTSAPFSVLLPAKPATFSRMINLDGQQVMMTMTAAEVDGVTYAVGTASLPDSEKARVALSSMKMALVKNINGTIKLEKSSEDKTAATASIEIDALGLSHTKSGDQPMRLIARFVARDKQVYQILIVGPEKTVPREAIDTFFTSFRLG